MARIKGKAFNAAAIDGICKALLEQGKIPSVAAVQNMGGSGDTKAVCAAIRNFKALHKEEIKRLRIESAETLTNRGSLTKALRFWNGR